MRFSVLIIMTLFIAVTGFADSDDVIPVFVNGHSSQGKNNLPAIRQNLLGDCVDVCNDYAAASEDPKLTCNAQKTNPDAGEVHTIGRIDGNKRKINCFCSCKEVEEDSLSTIIESKFFGF